jgi:hypothetical protein
MSEPKPKMSPLYGAAFGFNTDRRVKPVHFATGFFVALLGRNYRDELLNNVVAFSDGKDLTGNYALDNLHVELVRSGKMAVGVAKRELHTLRKHLRCLAGNDEATYPIYNEKPGFGCDYSTAAHDMLTRFSDNDGGAGFFAYSVLDVTDDGRFVLEFARRCLNTPNPTWRQVFQPLLETDYTEEVSANRYEAKFGPLDDKRVKNVAKRIAKQTAALRTLCENADILAATETKLRFLIIGLCLWLFHYLIVESVGKSGEAIALLADVSGDSRSRMRSQSRWSYARLRETLLTGFSAFADDGRFDECAEAWDYVKNKQNGRPKFEEFYRELALRSGLAQPRANRVPAKHFEPQPDTLRVLVLSVVPVTGEFFPLAQLLDRLYDIWALVFGGRPQDAEMLCRLGYVGLDQGRDLSPNAKALIELLSDLGLATRFSDGLVMCHSQPRF